MRDSYNRVADNYVETVTTTGVGDIRTHPWLKGEGVVDEYHQFVNPVVFGGGTPYFPPLAKPLDLQLTESRIFSSRVIYLRYKRTR